MVKGSHLHLMLRLTLRRCLKEGEESGHVAVVACRCMSTKESQRQAGEAVQAAAAAQNGPCPNALVPVSRWASRSRAWHECNAALTVAAAAAAPPLESFLPHAPQAF